MWHAGSVWKCLQWWRWYFHVGSLSTLLRCSLSISTTVIVFIHCTLPYWYERPCWNRTCHPGRHFIGTVILVLGLYIKSLQLFSKSGKHRCYLWLPDLQMNCGDLTTWQSARIGVPAMAAGQHAPLILMHVMLWVIHDVTVEMMSSYSSLVVIVFKLYKWVMTLLCPNLLYIPNSFRPHYGPWKSQAKSWFL